MPDLNKLKAVIDADAYGLSWAGKDDATVAQEIMTTQTAVVESVTQTLMQDWLAGPKYAKVYDGVTLGTTLQIRGNCLWLMDLIRSGLPYDRALHKFNLDTLVPEILSASQRNDLDNLADKTATIAQKESLGKVFTGHVTRARSL